MARIEKYKSYQVGRIFLHNNRTDSDGVTHSNEQIDNNRTHMNYSYKKGNAEDVGKRVRQVFSVGRSDATVMCEAVITLPKNVPEKDEKKFFQSVYNFFAEEFHEENIVNAVVHKDESRPHMHLDFVPVIRGDFSYRNESHHTSTRLEKWKAEHDGELERLCAKELLNREYFDNMHPRLSAYVEQDLGYETKIINGATENGNMSVVKLKLDTMKKQLEDLIEARKYLENEIAETYQLSQKYNIKPEQMKYLPLIEQIDFLFQREEIYKSIMKRNGYSYTREDIDKLKTLKSSANSSTNVSILDGSYVNEKEFEASTGTVMVFEIDNRELFNEKNCPQYGFCTARRGSEVRMKFREISKSKEVNLIEGTKGTYCYVHSPSEENICGVLAEMEREFRAYIKERRAKGERVKIIMDRLKNDRYNVGQIMLELLDVPVQYYSGMHTDKYESEEARERNMEKQQ